MKSYIKYFILSLCSVLILCILLITLNTILYNHKTFSNISKIQNNTNNININSHIPLNIHNGKYFKIISKYKYNKYFIPKIYIKNNTLYVFDNNKWNNFLRIMKFGSDNNEYINITIPYANNKKYNINVNQHRGLNISNININNLEIKNKMGNIKLNSNNISNMKLFNKFGDNYLNNLTLNKPNLISKYGNIYLSYSDIIYPDIYRKFSDIHQRKSIIKIP